MAFLQTSSATYQPKCRPQNEHTKQTFHIAPHYLINPATTTVSYSLTIRMNQKYTKSTCPIKSITLLYPIFRSLKNINEQELFNHSHNMVTLSHKPKYGYIFINKEGGQPRHEQHAIENKVSHPQFLLDIFIGNP